MTKSPHDTVYWEVGPGAVPDEDFVCMDISHPAASFTSSSTSSSVHKPHSKVVKFTSTTIITTPCGASTCDDHFDSKEGEKGEQVSNGRRVSFSNVLDETRHPMEPSSPFPQSNVLRRRIPGDEGLQREWKGGGSTVGGPEGREVSLTDKRKITTPRGGDQEPQRGMRSPNEEVREGYENGRRQSVKEPSDHQQQGITPNGNYRNNLITGERSGRTSPLPLYGVFQRPREFHSDGRSDWAPSDALAGGGSSNNNQGNSERVSYSIPSLGPRDPAFNEVGYCNDRGDSQEQSSQQLQLRLALAGAPFGGNYNTMDGDKITFLPPHTKSITFPVISDFHHQAYNNNCDGGNHTWCCISTNPAERFISSKDNQQMENCYDEKEKAIKVTSADEVKALMLEISVTQDETTTVMAKNAQLMLYYKTIQKRASHMKRMATKCRELITSVKNNITELKQELKGEERLPYDTSKEYEKKNVHTDGFVDGTGRRLSSSLASTLQSTEGGSRSSTSTSTSSRDYIEKKQPRELQQKKRASFSHEQLRSASVTAPETAENNKGMKQGKIPKLMRKYSVREIMDATSTADDGSNKKDDPSSLVMIQGKTVPTQKQRLIMPATEDDNRSSLTGQRGVVSEPHKLTIGTGPHLNSCLNKFDHDDNDEIDPDESIVISLGDTPPATYTIGDRAALLKMSNKEILRNINTYYFNLACGRAIKCCHKSHSVKEFQDNRDKEKGDYYQSNSNGNRRHSCSHSSMDKPIPRSLNIIDHPVYDIDLDEGSFKIRYDKRDCRCATFYLVQKKRIEAIERFISPYRDDTDGETINTLLATSETNCIALEDICDANIKYGAFKNSNPQSCEERMAHLLRKRETRMAAIVKGEAYDEPIRDGRVIRGVGDGQEKKKHFQATNTVITSPTVVATVHAGGLDGVTRGIKIPVTSAAVSTEGASSGPRLSAIIARRRSTQQREPMRKPSSAELEVLRSVMNEDLNDQKAQLAKEKTMVKAMEATTPQETQASATYTKSGKNRNRQEQQHSRKKQPSYPLKLYTTDKELSELQDIVESLSRRERMLLSDIACIKDQIERQQRENALVRATNDDLRQRIVDVKLLLEHFVQQNDELNKALKALRDAKRVQRDTERRIADENKQRKAESEMRKQAEIDEALRKKLEEIKGEPVTIPQKVSRMRSASPRGTMGGANSRPWVRNPSPTGSARFNRIVAIPGIRTSSRYETVPPLTTLFSPGSYEIDRRQFLSPPHHQADGMPYSGKIYRSPSPSSSPFPSNRGPLTARAAMSEYADGKPAIHFESITRGAAVSDMVARNEALKQLLVNNALMMERLVLARIKKGTLERETVGSNVEQHVRTEKGGGVVSSLYRTHGGRGTSESGVRSEQGGGPMVQGLETADGADIRNRINIY